MGFCLPTENGKEATSLEIRKDREKSAYIKSRRKEITPSIAGRDFRLSFHLTLPLKPDLVSLSSSCLQRGHNASKTNCVSKMVLSAAEKRRKEVQKSSSFSSYFRLARKPKSCSSLFLYSLPENGTQYGSQGFHLIIVVSESSSKQTCFMINVC